MSSSSSNFAISRFNNPNITDVGIRNQGQPLLRIVTIDSTSPQWILAGIGQALENNDLAFMESGSLFSLKSGKPFYPSPFYAGTTPEKPSNVNVINNNPLFSPINRGVNTNPLGLQGKIYVSPHQGKFILQSTADDNNIGVYNVYYNPINRSDISDDTILQTLTSYCDMVNFSDPTCFCQNGTEACGNYVTGGNYDSLSGEDKANLANNCAVLSPMCQKWAQYGNKFTEDEIKASLKANPQGVPICGNNFTYSQGNVISTNGSSILQSCGLQPKPTPPPNGNPSTPITPVPSNPSKTPTPSKTPETDPKKMSTGVMVLIAIIVMVLIIAVGMYL